jgi:hypothetical protein
MKNILMFLNAMLLLAETSLAQLSGAPFSTSTGTYTEITGGTVLGNTSTNDQVFINPAAPLGQTTTTTGVQGPGFPIGFNFSFDGTVFDMFAVNANGWISLGQSALGSSAVWMVSATGPLGMTVTNITPPQLTARMAALGCNLAGQAGSSLRIQTIGTAPNRECVVQWKGFRVNGQTGDNLNFQIRLIETTNEVKFIYGLMSKNATAVNAQVGMRDKPPTMAINYANRILNPTWATTAPGTTSGPSCQLSNTKFPANGLTYTYGPVPACTGTPNPGNTLSTSTLLCPGTNFTLTLQNFTDGYDVTYQWQYSLTGSAPWSNVNTPAPPHYSQITLSETESTWYRCMVTCSGNSTASNPIQVAVNTWLYCGYCAPTYTGGPPYLGPAVFDNVILVTLYPLSQATGNNIANDYYKQYVYTQNAIPDITKGQLFNLELTFNTDTAQYFGVWIDFDHSSSFDADEFFSTGTNAGPSGFISFPITVPSDAFSGQTRLRIRGGDNVALSPGQACGVSNSVQGCAQDYLVNIVEPVILSGHVYDSQGNPLAGALVECIDRGTAYSDGSGYYSMPIPSGTQQLKCSKTSYNTVILTPTIPPSAPVTQDFTLNNPTIAVTPASIFMALPSGSSADASVQIINGGTGTLNWDAKVNYNVNRAADVTYCTGGSFTCSLGINMYISRFVLNTIDNTSACSTYSDFTGISTILVPGESYILSITEGGPYTSIDKVWIWIDYDQNGQFNENPIKLTGTPPNQSASFMVPRDVRPGSTRLRIRLASDQDPLPCGSFNYGEVEDYTVSILSWLTLDNNFGAVAPGTTSTIPVHINAAKAEDGNPGIPGQSYVSKLTFDSDPATGAVTIPVTLAITDPSLPMPEDLTGNIVNWNGGKIKLYWNYFMGRNGVLDHFVILRNGEIVGTAKIRTFEDVLRTDGNYCYKVYAVYDNGAYSEPSNELCITYPFPERIPLAGWAIGLGALLIVGYTIFLIRRRVI